MKKIYTLIAAAALAIGGISYAAVGDVVLQSDFSKSPADGPGTGETWTKVNGGEGTSASATFMTNSAAGHGDDSAYRLWTATEGLQNDWLVSPKLALETGKTYEVSCWIRMSNADSKVGHVALHHTTVYPTIDGQNSNILPSAALEQYNEVTGTSQNANEDATLFSYTKLSGKFVAAEGNNYVALHVSGTCYRGVIVSDFKVVEATGSTDPVTPIDPDPEQPGDHTCVEGVVNVPYTTPIATSASTYDEAWTRINANTDAKEWSPISKSDFETGFAMQMSYASNMNDFLISPAIHMEAGKEYVVGYTFATRGADELLSVYLTESADPEEIKASTPIDEQLKVNTNQNATKKSVVVAPTKTGDYHLTFWGHTEGNKWYIWVGDVKILENVFAPGAVTNLTATPAENPTLEVALAWALPTVDQFGGEMGEDKVFEKVEIYRDEEERPIASIEDKEAATSFTDSEATGLTSGKHTYSVVVTYNGVASPAAKVGPTAYVGPFEVLALPADMTFAADMKGAWKQAYGEGHPEDANKWVTYSSSNPDRWQFVAKRNSTCDAWLFSPEFNIPAPGFYDFTLDAINGSTYTKTYAHSYLSTTQDLNGARTELPFNWTAVRGSSTTLKATVYVAEAGTYSIATGVVIDDPANASSAFNHAIKAWKVAQGQMIPKEVTNLQAKAADDESLSIKVSWTNPTENTANTALEAGQWYVKVWRSDASGRNYAVIATLNNGESEYTDNELPEAGAYYYMVQTLATADDATNTESNPATLSSWAGSRELAMPYSVRMNSATGENASRYIWEAIDANKDGKGWGFGYSDRMVCAQPAEAVADKADWYKYEDYLLSPIFTLEPGYYQLDFQMWGRTSTHYVNQESNYDMAMSVGLCGAGQFLPERPELIGKTRVVSNSTSYKTQTVLFHVEEAGKYQIVFAADEENYKQYSTSTEIGLGLVEFKGKDVLPRAATELSVEPGADGALTALVKWTNPTTTNIEGVTPELVKAEIYRDTELIGSVEEGLTPGEQSEWLDEAALAGKHTYAVRMYTAAGAQQDADASVVSPWIGKGLEAPYSVEAGNFEKDGWEDASPNINIQTTTWSTYIYDGFDLNGSNGAKYDPENFTSSVDGYLLSPKFEIEEGTVYKLTFKSFKTSMGSLTSYPVDILVGSEGDPSGWTKLGSFEVTGSMLSSASEHTLYIKGAEIVAEPAPEPEPEEGVDAQADEAEPTEPEQPEEPAAAGTDHDSAVAAGSGTRRIAFHINTNFDSGYFWLNKFAIENDGPSTGIESIGVAGGVVLEGGKLFFEGTAEDVRIYDLAGKLLRFAEEAEGSISLEGLAKGVYVVRFSLEGEAVAIKLAR